MDSNFEKAAAPKVAMAKDCCDFITFCRSALEGVKDIGPKEFPPYWETGVRFDEQDQLAKANEINPTLAFSAMGKGFALHYRSDPILPFHLAKTLAPISSSQSVSLRALWKNSILGALLSIGARRNAPP